MIAIWAVSFYFLLSVLFVTTTDSQPSAYTYTGGSLWCLQGGKKVYSPAQCPEETTECFKFRCDGIEEPFIARGCGLSVLTSAAGLPNESCHQAQSVCERVGGKSSCFTCNNRHMCNLSPTGSFDFTSLFVVVVSVALTLR